MCVAGFGSLGGLAHGRVSGAKSFGSVHFAPQGLRENFLLNRA